MRPSFVMSGVATGLRRNLSMTIALILNTAIALSFAGGAILVSQFIGKFQTNYEDKLNVSVYLCTKPPYAVGSQCTHQVTDTELSALRSRMANDSRITSTSYLDEQASFERAKEVLPADQTEQAAVGDFPALLVLKLKNIKTGYEGVAKDYGTADGVDAVQNQSDSLKTLLTIFDKARIGAAIAAVAIMICALLLMANAIQVAANQRRNETGIMRLVGASRWMTQLPFILEAVIAALIGGVLAIVLDYVGKVLILDGIFKQQVESGVLPQLSTNDILLAGGAGAIGGLVLAALTAYATLRLLVRL
ncbi:MAG: cell division protein FtsX [Pseudonocardiales bacterium]|nr:cell division protein FtsX [Pseudonocardiales bacterium]